MGKKKAKKNTGHKKTRTFSFELLKQKRRFILPILIVLVIVCLFINSDFWPWPSASKTKTQLNDVIETCSKNEKSSECSDIKTKHRATFIYCYSFFDVPSINDGPHVFAVAYKDKTSIPKYKGDYGQSFYGCSEYMENVGKNIPEESISEANNPALTFLTEIPHDLTNCVNNGPNYIWELVPGIEQINSLYDSMKSQNVYCNAIQNAFAPTKTKMDNYAKNPAVRRFFAEYGSYLDPFSDGKEVTPAGKACTYKTSDGKSSIYPGKCIGADSLTEFISSKIKEADSSSRLVYKRV